MLVPLRQFRGHANFINQKDNLSATTPTCLIEQKGEFMPDTIVIQPAEFNSAPHCAEYFYFISDIFRGTKMTALSFLNLCLTHTG